MQVWTKETIIFRIGTLTNCYLNLFISFLRISVILQKQDSTVNEIFIR